MRTNAPNVGYLVVGVAFLGIAASWTLVVGDVLPSSSLRFALPLVLVIAGLIGLAAMLFLGLGRTGPENAPAPEGLDNTNTLGESS